MFLRGWRTKTAARARFARSGSWRPWLAAFTLVFPAAALAQMQGTPAPGGPPGGFAGERADTGSSAGTLDYMHDLEKFAFDGTGTPEAKKFARRAAAFLLASNGRRDQAFALGKAAQRGEQIDVPSVTVRRDLEQDLTDWRTAFDVPSNQYRAVRDKLLADGDGLTPAKWAIRRASWFQARDRWIEERKRSLGIAP